MENVDCLLRLNLQWFNKNINQNFNFQILILYIDFNFQVQHLDKKITKQRYQIKDLRKQLEDRQKKLKIREFYLIQILKQFQKFINFVLKATPTQAEFLLNIEKITRTELDIAVSILFFLQYV